MDLLKTSKGEIKSLPCSPTKNLKYFEDGDEQYTLLFEGVQIGTLILKRSFPLPGFTQLKYLAIKENYRGQGFASALIKPLKSHLRSTLWLDSKDHKLDALWEKNGFKKEAGRWLL